MLEIVILPTLNSEIPSSYNNARVLFYLIQGEAIAQNLRTMFGLKVPIVTVVGEGGSGGALAIACPNKLFMLENSVLYVAR